MALHYDFPYQSAELYCKTCKKTTIHTSTNIDYKCEVCGRKWTGSLLKVNINQDTYGKIHYECVDLRDKPVNSVEYPRTVFDNLDDCLNWLKEMENGFINGLRK